MNKIAYEERKEIYEKARRTWGTQAQIMMAIEEMSELTKELCKHFRGRPNGEEIVEATENELFGLYLERGMDDVMDFHEYRRRMEHAGCKVVDGNE